MRIDNTHTRPKWYSIYLQQEERTVYKNQPLVMLRFPHGQQIHSVDTYGHVAAYTTPGAEWKDTDPSPI